MRALRPGLWHWRASHPDWRPSEPWDQNVSSYAIDDGERLLLFDPIALPSEIEKLAIERETAVVLTAPWHERDTQGLVEQLGVPVYTPLPDTAEYLMQTCGVTAEQAGDGSPDVVWLLKEGKGEARPYAAGDRLDVGVDVFPGQKLNDTVLWIESHRAVVAGDTLVDFGNGLEINEGWLELQRVTREQVVAGLRPLLELPVEHVLATHGGPFERAALERALSFLAVQATFPARSRMRVSCRRRPDEAAPADNDDLHRGRRTHRHSCFFRSARGRPDRTSAASSASASSTRRRAAPVRSNG